MTVNYELPNRALSAGVGANARHASLGEVLIETARIAVAEELRGWESELPADVAEKLRARADTIDPAGAQ